MTPIFQEDNGTEKRWASSNLLLGQCLVHDPRCLHHPAWTLREPLPNLLSFKAVQNDAAYLSNTAINKHSRHRHILFMISSVNTYWWGFYKDWSEKSCFPAIWACFTSTSESLCIESHATTGHRFQSVFCMTHTALFIKDWLIREACLLSVRSTLAVSLTRGHRQWLWRAC